MEFFYGDPDPALVARVHQGRALVCWQVGSLDEARAAIDAGCDLLAAQGVEAGGHVRGRVALLSLLEGVLDVVDVPVIAGGGIGTARGVAAVLAAGAAGARIGTRFVASVESNAHPDYVKALLGAGDADAVLTEVFDVGWPNAPHRVLQSCIDAASAFDGDMAGETEGGGGMSPLPKYAPPTPTRTTTGRIDVMALYAGQGVGAVQRVDPAADIVRELADGAAELLERSRPRD